MKNIITAALTIFSFAAFSRGQSPDTFCINTCRMTISTNIDDRGYISVQIPQLTLQEAQQDWLTYIGYGNTGQDNAVNGESLHTGMINKMISPDAFNLSSRLVETIGGIRLTVWFTEPDMLRARQVQNENSNQALQKYVLDFAAVEYKRIVQDELRYSQERQLDLQTELRNCKMDQARLLKETKENKANIKCAYETMVIYNSGIQRLTDQIDFQKAITKNSSSESNTGSQTQKEMNMMMSERKTLITANTKIHSDIDLWNKEIKDDARYMIKCKEKQTANGPDTDRQNIYVAEVQAEYDSIH